jgi:hypothetical protein
MTRPPVHIVWILSDLDGMGWRRHSFVRVEIFIVTDPARSVSRLCELSRTVAIQSRYRLDFSGTTSLSTTPDQSHAQRQVLPPRSRTPTHLKLFFISRSLVMMAMGSVSPVAFWISGSCPQVSQQRYPGIRGSYLRPHEDVVLLLVANGELALRLAVVRGVRLQGLDGLAGED